MTQYHNHRHQRTATYIVDSRNNYGYFTRTLGRAIEESRGAFINQKVIQCGISIGASTEGQCRAIREMNQTSQESCTMEPTIHMSLVKDAKIRHRGDEAQNGRIL
jgi:hypothetical protein